MNDLVDLFARLEHCHIDPQAVDKFKWGHQKGVYTVKEGYQQLCSRNPMIINGPGNSLGGPRSTHLQS